MTNLANHSPNPQEKDFQIDLNWQENSSVKNLLNVIVSILAE